MRARKVSQDGARLGAQTKKTYLDLLNEVLSKQLCRSDPLFQNRRSDCHRNVLHEKKQFRIDCLLLLERSEAKEHGLPIEVEDWDSDIHLRRITIG